MIGRGFTGDPWDYLTAEYVASSPDAFDNTFTLGPNREVLHAKVNLSVKADGT